MEAIIDLLKDVPKQNYDYRMRLIMDTIKFVSSPRYINKAKLMVVRLEDKLMTDFDSLCVTLDDYRYQQKIEKRELRKERMIMLKQTNELIKKKNAEYDAEWRAKNPDVEVYTKINDQIELENNLTMPESIKNIYTGKLSMSPDINNIIKYDLKSRWFLKENGYQYQKPESVHNNMINFHADRTKSKAQNEELMIKLNNKDSEMIETNNRKTYLEALLTTIEEVNESKLSRMKSAISELLYTTNEYLGETGVVTNTDDMNNQSSTGKSSNAPITKDSERSILIKKKIAEYTDAYLKFQQTVELRERVDDISDFYSNSEYDDDSNNEWDNEYDD